MEEAERVAEQVAVIDHGKIVAQGSPEALKEAPGRKTLEDAFIAAYRAYHPRRGSLFGGPHEDDETSLEGPVRAIYILWLRQLKRL